MRTSIATLTLLAIATVQAHAEVSVKEYKEALASPTGDIIRIYVRGLGEGIEWANINATATKTTGPLYCQPEKLALGLANFIDIIDRQIEEASTFMTAEQLNNTFIGLLLMKGLKDTFPCKSK